MADRLDEHLLPAGLAPALWSVFDPIWYRTAHALPDSTGTCFADLRTHWLEHGQPAGLSPTMYFDESWYRTTNPDVAAAIAAGTWRSGFEHYALAGHADRAPHWLFDLGFYRAHHPDITDASLREAGCFNAYDHYLRGGAAEGRRCHPLFDPGYYLSHQADPTAAANPFTHALTALWHGTEPATSPCFDAAWYSASLAVARSPRTRLGALHHYLTNPTPAAFDPLPDFSEAYYLASNPDAADLITAGIFRNGYDHFLAAGATELRAPCAWIDLKAYAAHPQVAADLAAGHTADAFTHLLTTGRQRGLTGATPSGHDDGTSGLLPLLTRGRLDFSLSGPPLVTALVVMPVERAHVLPALEALRAALPGQIDLVLLDWNGNGAGLQALATGARLQPLSRAPGGLARARNAALATSTAGLTLLLDGTARPSPTGLRAAVARMAATPDIGALGGPILGTNGTLIEAGQILWSDASRTAYLHGAPAQVSEAGFVRDVDLISSTQLLLRTPLLRDLGGFAENLTDADAETDLAIRIWRAGYRITLDPALAIRLPGSRALRTTSLPTAASPTLRQRHPAYLRRRPSPGSLSDHTARTPRHPAETVLLITPTLPGPTETIAALTATGATITLYPLDGGPADPALLPTTLPDTTEIICGPGTAGLDAFRAARGAAFSRVIEG